MDKTIMGQRLRMLMAKDGWTCASLAAAASVTKNQVSMLRTGTLNGVTLDTVAKVAKTLGVSISDLVGETTLEIAGVVQWFTVTDGAKRIGTCYNTDERAQGSAEKGHRYERLPTTEPRRSRRDLAAVPG